MKPAPVAADINKGKQSTYRPTVRPHKITPTHVGTFTGGGRIGSRGVPRHVKFTKGGAKLLYLQAQTDATGQLRQTLLVNDLASGANSKAAELCAPPAHATEGKLTHEEELRRERLRELATGITQYHWADKGEVLLVPIGNALCVNTKEAAAAAAATTTTPAPA